MLECGECEATKVHKLDCKIGRESEKTIKLAALALESYKAIIAERDPEWEYDELDEAMLRIDRKITSCGYVLSDLERSLLKFVGVDFSNLG